MVESDTRAAHFTDTRRNVKPPESDIVTSESGQPRDEDIRGEAWGQLV